MLDVASIPVSYTVLNFVLAMAMYTLMARFVLAIFFDETSGMVIWKVFRQITDPMLLAFRAITPAVVPGGLVMLFALVWIIAARLMLLLFYLSNGWINLGAPS
jgi:uncharacterized protein YggT (Ycf19 family)